MRDYIAGRENEGVRTLLQGRRENRVRSIHSSTTASSLRSRSCICFNSPRVRFAGAASSLVVGVPLVCRQLSTSHSPSVVSDQSRSCSPGRSPTVRTRRYLPPSSPGFTLSVSELVLTEALGSQGGGTHVFTPKSREQVEEGNHLFSRSLSVAHIYVNISESQIFSPCNILWHPRDAPSAIRSVTGVNLAQREDLSPDLHVV